MKAALQAAVKDAMRAKDKLRLSVLRGVLSAMQYEELRQGKEELSGDECLALIQNEVKKRKEAQSYAEQDGRPEMVEELQGELKVLEEFLPQQLNEQELERIVRGMRASTPGLTLGEIMKRLKADYAGRFDGKAASDIGKRVLAEG